MLALLVLLASLSVRAQTNVTLSATATPSAGQAGVTTVTITGTGFPAGTIAAAATTLTLQPATAGAGPTATTRAATVVALAGTTRRITFVVPASVGVTAPTAYRVSVAGQTSTGTAFVSANFASLTVNPPPAIQSLTPASAPAPSTITVAIAATYTNFVQGATQANFGPGISVGGAAAGAFGPVNVTSPTTATAALVIDASATPGGHQVSVRTGVQVASVSGLFAVTPSNRGPVAQAAGPATGAVGAALAFSSAGSNDPDGDPLTYSWAFGDGTPASTQANPAHTFTEPGTYMVTLTVTDPGGLSATASVSVDVSPVNRPPVAQASGPATGDEGAALAFSSAGSNDPENDPLTYSWTFDDGTPASTLANPSHVFAEPGSYTVTLTVTDPGGLSATATVSVVINRINRPPSAVPGGPYSGVAGGAVTFDGRASSDPDGDGLTFSWNFGDGTPAATSAQPAHTFAVAGTFTVTLTVTDVHGATATATVDVPVVGANAAPTANPGGPYSGEAGVAITFDGSRSSDPDGPQLTYAWNFGDGTPAGSGVRPTHVYATAGSYAVTLTVTDPGDAAHSASTTATVTVSVDRVPPNVSMIAASQALPGTQVLATVDATDNVAVSSVTIDINGTDPLSLTAPPYQRLVTVPDVAAPGSSVEVRARAVDPSGNEGAALAQITIVALPDTAPPTVSLAVPPQAAAGQSVRVTADAADNVGVTGVEFAANTTPIGSASVAPYQVPYVVPADAPVGAVLTFTADAADAAANRARATATLTVVGVADRDEAPPSLTLVVPPSVVAGTAFTAISTAADASGIASVSTFVDAARIGLRVVPPYEARFTVPASVLPGTQLRVTAVAVDGVGRETTATADVLVVAPSAGLLTGVVLDDATGQPLAGASVSLVGEDERGVAYSQAAVSDSRGRYVLHAVAGQGTVHVSKPGFTTLEREVAIQAATALRVIDTRLTAAGTLALPILAAAGGTISGTALPFLDVWQRDLVTRTDPYVTALAAGTPTVSLTVGAGSLAADATISLTGVSRQGLATLLPVGWTPIAGVDIAPHGLAFGTPATLTVPLPVRLAADTPLALVQFDPSARVWRALSVMSVAQGATTLSASLPASGQLAWVLADVLPVAPPPAVPGEVLSGVEPSLIPLTATAVVDPQPRIIFYRPGVKSDVRGRVTSTAPLSSGTLARTRILESYDFFSGAEMQLAPTLQDVVLYQVPGTGGSTLLAGYPVAPSLTFEALSLRTGVITVELRAPGALQDRVDTIADGGSVTTPSGERVELPAGSISSPMPVTLSALSTAEVGVPAPEGFEIVGALLLDFAQGLDTPATISVPRAPEVLDGDLVIVARLQELLGRTRFAMVGVGGVGADRVSSRTDVAGSSVTLEGARVPGRYVFLRATGTAAFAAGFVSGSDNAPFAGAVVATAPTAALVALSQAGGRYLTAIPVGGATLTARHPLTGDSGSGPANATTAREIVQRDLSLAARFPTVAGVTPQQGAESVPLSGPVVVTFTTPIDPGTATAASFFLSSPTGPIAGTREFSNGNTVVTFRAAQPLAPDTVHTLTLTTTIADPFGRALQAPVSVSFTSLDTNAPPPPPAGSISASIPVGGASTVSVTQGAAGSRDTVVIRNVSRGTTTPIGVVDPSVGFTVPVQAGFTDILELVIRDRSGNETVVRIPAFRSVNADGSVATAITAAGGRVDGPAGIGIDVPAGAFPAGAVLRVKPVTEAEFPIALTPEQRQFFSFAGGLELDFGGATLVNGYLNVSLPGTGTETIDDQWVVGVVKEIAGQPLLHSVDTARLIGGRIATSSPPCPGVTGSGVYGFLRAARPMGVIYGRGPTEDPSRFATAYAMATVKMAIDATDLLQSPLSVATDLAADAQALFAAMPRSMCLPLLGGRLSATPNRVGFTAPAGELKATDRKLVIRNLNTGAETKFYPPFDATFSVEGANGDSFAAIATEPDTSTRTVALTLVPRSYVVAAVDAAGLATTDKEIAIRNTTRGTGWSSALAGGTFHPLSTIRAIVEGTAADTYTASVTDVGGAIRSVPVAVGNYALGTGRLLLRALPGTIDPTHAEIVAYNATVPPDRQIPVNGVTRVDVEEFDAEGLPVSTETLLGAASTSAVIVGGGFVHAVNGTFDHQYRLRIFYENASMDVLAFPTFRVTVRESGGGPLKEIVGFVPPRGEPMFIDVNLGGPTPTVQTPPGAFSAMDPRAPLSFVLSQPLNAASVAGHLALFEINATGPPVPVEGTFRLSADGRTVTFLPTEPLAFGGTYRLDFNGVTTASGIDVPVSSVLVTTFSPKKLATIALPEPHAAVVGVTGVSTPHALSFTDFVRTKRTEPVSGLNHLLIASSGNQTGFKFHNFDVTNARAPSEAGHTAGGRPRRLTLVDNVVRPEIDIEYDVPLIGQPTDMSCWAAAMAMIVAWANDISIDPRSIALAMHDVHSWLHQYEKGLKPSNIGELFNEWGLVAEPPASRTVQQFKDLLETYGPLWVAGAQPFGHARVVTGLFGDGTPEGTFVIVNDPWEEGMATFHLPNSGSRTSETYAEFVAAQERLARRLFFDEQGIQDRCDLGSALFCQVAGNQALKDSLQACASGNTTVCASFTAQLTTVCTANPGSVACELLAMFPLTTASSGVLIGHLPARPPGKAPNPPANAGLVLQGGTGLEPDEQPDTPRIMGLIAGCSAHVAIDASGKPAFAGKLLVSSNQSNFGVSIGFYDVSDPAAPCMIGDKPLTRNPESLPPPGSADQSARGTFTGFGIAGGVAVLQTTTGYAAYVAVGEQGLMAVDVGKNIPAQYAFYRQREGMYSGDYVDVVAVDGRLLALNNGYGGGPSLDVFDGSLGLQASLAFPLQMNLSSLTKVHQVKVATGVFVDKNQNGNRDEGEVLSLAYVAGSNGVTVIDITDLDRMSPIGVVPMPGIVRELAVSRTGRLLLAGGDTSLSSVGGMAFFVIDLSDPTISTKIDKDNDGRDDRIAFESPYPQYINALQIDDERDLAFVGSDVAVDIWAISRRGAASFNQAPTADAGPDQLVAKLDLVPLDGSASHDPENDSLGFSWTQISGPPVALNGAAGATPTFTAPDIENATLVFQLTVNDGVTASAPDTVAIKTKQTAQLALRPYIAPVIVVPGTTNLTVTLDLGTGGGPSPVTADPKTEYRWLGHGLVSGVDGIPDITGILNALIAKLGIPVTLADISIDGGVVTVNTPGIQIVRAHHKDGDLEVDSNPTLILAGLSLKEITLRPESPITTLLGEVTLALGSKKNPPMILVADENGYVFDKGLVLLDDVVFEMLGHATISLKDLVGAVRPAIDAPLTEALALEAGPAAPVLARVFSKLLINGGSYAGTQALDLGVCGNQPVPAFKCPDPLVASVSDQAPLQGWVQAHGPGLTRIGGELNLGPLGKADDSVLVWVLPSISSVRVEPDLTAIRRSDPAQPGPTVRTWVEVNAIDNASIPLRGKANTAAELLDRFLPDGLASWATGIDKTFVLHSPAPNLKFRIRGSLLPACSGPHAGGEMQCEVAFANVGLGFYAPNTLQPLITNDYVIGPQANGGPPVATLGAREFVDTHIVRGNELGTSPLSGTVSIPGMGSKTDPTAKIVVTDGGPVLLKTYGSLKPVKVGSLVRFKVSVTNPYDTPLQNVQVTDTVYFTPDGGIETVFGAIALPPIAEIAPHATYQFETSLTMVVAPSAVGELRNQVTATGAAPASVTVLVVDDLLELEPELIVKATTPAVQQLTVTLRHGNGTSEDVTTDGTTYTWIGAGVPRAVVDRIYTEINTELVAAGQSPLPFQIAAVSVDPGTGVLSITSPGLQLIQASRGGLRSGVSVVLAGITLKKITLSPVSKLNTLQSALVEMKKPPMILAADAPGNGFFDRTGQVLLTDASFEILGGPATISATKLVKALSSVVGDAVTAYAAGTGPLARVFGWAASTVLSGAISEAATQMLEPLTSTAPTIASVLDQSSASLPTNPVGRVDAHLPGITNIKGTLDLAEYGKASDNVFTWVLPALTSARLEPQIVVIDLDQNPQPEHKVRTFATLNFGGTAVLPLSGRWASAAEALNAFVAGGWTGTGATTFALSARATVNSPVEKFTFAFDSAATVTCTSPGAEESGCTVQVNSLTIGFHVPHQPPVILDTYVTNPAIATTTLDANQFDTHVTGVAPGQSVLESHVDMTALNMGTAADTSGLVIVFRRPPPPEPLFVEKRALGGSTFVPPGGTLDYEVIVANPTATPMTDVTVVDTLRFNGVVIATHSVEIGDLDAYQGRRVRLPTVTAPSAVGVLENEITATGIPPRRVRRAVRRQLINEIVVQPQRDWDDSGAGGNGTPFDDTPGTALAPDGAVTAADQWIEIVTQTGTPDELRNFTLEFVNTAGASVSLTLTPANMRTVAGSPYVVVGAPGGIAATSVITLRDTVNNVVDTVDLPALTTLLGPATGTANEAIARDPDGFSTGNPTDFLRQPASIGATNP